MRRLESPLRDHFEGSYFFYLAKIFRAYYWAKDEDYGIPTLYQTVFSNHDTKHHGMHGIDDESLGYMPFHEVVRERTGRAILESRGIGEIAALDQQGIKENRDARGDRSSLATLPPKLVDERMAGEDTDVTPGGEVLRRRGNEIEFMKVPALDGGSVEIEETELNWILAYFGRGPLLSDSEKTAYLQKLTDKFLGEVMFVGRRIYQLVQTRMDQQEVEEVVGPLGRAWPPSKEEIRKAPVLRMTFDVLTLDPEAVDRKLQQMERVESSDSQGILNRAIWTKIKVAMIDPTLADIAVQSEEAAFEAESEDERNKFAQIVAGVEPERSEEGNHMVRLQTLNQILEENPEIMQTITPASRSILERRLEHLYGLAVVQPRNAQTGRDQAQMELNQA